jgi:hypothetical protein
VNRRVGRIVLITVGVIAVLVGGVWTGQGLNLIPGGVMSGSRFWLIIGVILIVIGIIVVTLGLRRSGRDRTST